MKKRFIFYYEDTVLLYDKTWENLFLMKTRIFGEVYSINLFAVTRHLQFCIFLQRSMISWCRCSDGLRFDHVGICYITKLRTIVSFNIQTHVYLIIFTVIFHNSGTKIKTICFWRSDLSVIQSLYVISDNQNIIAIYFFFFSSLDCHSTAALCTARFWKLMIGLQNKSQTFS